MADESSRGASIRARVLRGTVSNYLGRVVNLVMWVLLTPLMLNYVGATGYGLWVLAGSLVAFGTLLDFAEGSAVTKYVAEFRARGETSNVRSLVATAMLASLVSGVLAALLLTSLSSFIISLFSVPRTQQDEARLIIVLTGVMLGVMIAGTPIQAVLRGLHRYDLFNLVEIAASLFWGLAIVIALVSGAGVAGMIALNIPLILVMRVVTTRLVRRVDSNVTFGMRGANMAMFRVLFGFNSFLFLTQVSERMKKRSDEIIVGSLISVAAVTPYAIARKFSELAYVLTDQFVRVLLPLASELHAQEDPSRLRVLYIVSTRMTVAIFLPLALMLVILAGPIIRAWVGPEFESFTPLVTILMVASLVATSQWPAVALLQGVGRVRVVAAAALLSGLANLVLSIGLVIPFGLTGVALGTLIPTVVEGLGVMLPYAMRVMDVGVRVALKHIWLPAFLPGLPMAVVMYLLMGAMGTESIWSVVAISAMGLSTYAVVYLSMGPTSRERDVLRVLGGSAMRRLQGSAQK